MSAVYKGYTAALTIDLAAGVIHGEIADIPDVATFEVRGVAKVERAFQMAVEDYLEMCRERGEEPARPAVIGDLVEFTDNSGVLWRGAVVDRRPDSAPGWAFVACLSNPYVIPVRLSALKVVERRWWLGRQEAAR